MHDIHSSWAKTKLGMFFAAVGIDCVTLAIFACGAIGYLGCTGRTDGKTIGPLDAIHFSLALKHHREKEIVEEVPLLLEVARFSAWLTPEPYLLLATTLAALSIARNEYWLWVMRRRIIVAGGGRLALAICTQLRKLGRNVVVIEKNAEAAHIPALKDIGVIVLIGDASDEPMLRAAGLRYAERLIVSIHDDAVALKIVATAHVVNGQS